MLRGGALRQGGLGQTSPNAAPTAPASVAPGLAIAPAKAAEKSGKPDEKSKKPSGLVILLIVLNFILILALVILGFFLLHRH